MTLSDTHECIIFTARAHALQVTGVITDKAGKARWVVQGTWDEKLEGAKVLQTIENKGKTVYETGPTKLLWQRRPITYVCGRLSARHQGCRRSQNNLHMRCSIMYY